MTKRRFVIVIALSVLATGTFLIRARAAMPRVNDSLIVQTERLEAHLNDDSLVLLQVGDQKEFAEAHIPGAQFIQLQDISTPRGQGLNLELPAVDQLKSTFEKLGVTDKSRIVVYFGKDWVTPTARVY